MEKKIEDLLRKGIEDNHFSVNTAVIPSLLTYLDLLERWNKVFNLTAIRDVHEMVPLHILDSLAIKPFMTGLSTLDVGTGAGLPGIPLALCLPAQKFTLLDSNSKKTRFLTQVKAELKISNIEVVNNRCEDFSVDQGFDTIVSRAFSSLSNMVESTAHLLKPNGQFIAMKGVYPQAEIDALPKGFTVTAVDKIVIKGLNAERHVVSIQRIQG